MRRVTLSGVEILHRILQHVLPLGCTKVRYRRLWTPTRRARLTARTLPGAVPLAASIAPAALTWSTSPVALPQPARCPLWHPHPRRGPPSATGPVAITASRPGLVRSIARSHALGREAVLLSGMCGRFLAAIRSPEASLRRAASPFSRPLEHPNPASGLPPPDTSSC